MSRYNALIFIFLSILLTSCGSKWGYQAGKNTAALTGAQPSPPEAPPSDPTPVVDDYNTDPPTPIPAAVGGEPTELPKAENCKQGEGFCETHKTIYRMIDGRPYNRTYLERHAGGPPDRMFQKGGSLNIPVLAHAGLYYLEPQNQRAWFNQYFDLQLASVGFQGREVLSNHYAHAVVSAVFLVHYVSRKMGHQDVALKARQWLRAYWALSSLVAIDRNLSKGIYHLWNSQPEDVGNAKYYTGYTSVTAGPRTLKGGMGAPDHNGQFMLSMALSNPNRSIKHQVWADSFGIVLRLEGYFINNEGKVNLREKDSLAKDFGLSTQERSDLKQFINSNGTQKLEAVLNMIRPYKPACDLTFYRTDEGVISWMGTSTTQQEQCNRNKGPYFAVSVDTASGVAHYLRPTYQENPSETGFSYREGEMICAETANAIKKCIDIPRGQKTLEVSWTKTDGLVVH